MFTSVGTDEQQLCICMCVGVLPAGRMTECFLTGCYLPEHCFDIAHSAFTSQPTYLMQLFPEGCACRITYTTFQKVKEWANEMACGAFCSAFVPKQSCDVFQRSTRLIKSINSENKLYWRWLEHWQLTVTPCRLTYTVWYETCVNLAKNVLIFNWMASTFFLVKICYKNKKSGFQLKVQCVMFGLSVIFYIGKYNVYAAHK